MEPFRYALRFWAAFHRIHYSSHHWSQFAMYEQLKTWIPADRQTLWGMSSTFAIGSVSKLVATTATYPYQVVKARMQSRSASGKAPYRGVWDCVTQTAKVGGWRTFYAGYTANIIRVVPSGAITLMLYELTKPSFAALLSTGQKGQGWDR